MTIIPHFSQETLWPMGSSWIVIGLLIAGLSMYTIIRRRQSTLRGQYPPGPYGYPIIGNLFQLRNKNIWFTFTRWNQQYGPLLYLNIAGHSAIVIGSHETAIELLDRRQSIYSGRPRFIVASELFTGGLCVACIQPDDVWKRMHRAAHEALNKQTALQYAGMHEKEAIILVSQLLKDPQRFGDHICRASVSLVMAVLYGLPPIMDSDDPNISRINEFAQRFASALMPGTYLVDHFTWMMHLPRWMCSWRRFAEDCFIRDSAMLEELCDDVGRRMQNSDQPSSLVATIMQDQHHKRLSVRETAWLCGTLYAAGAETISGVMNWFILAMVLHPESQARAQTEIDRVVGRDRVPTLKNYNDLPYLRALLNEVMRWRPVDPLGIPHRLTKDDWYNGYFIPKDTVCLVNLWNLNMDPKIYGSDVDRFRPERFLGNDGQFKSMPLGTKEDATYGFGKRVCVGRHLANNSLFAQIATILWALNIRPSKKDGLNVLPDPNGFLNSGVSVQPQPFSCEFTPRFSGVENVLSEMKDQLELPM